MRKAFGTLALSLPLALAGAGNGQAADATCSLATLHGRYLFAFDGGRVEGSKRRPFAVAGYEVYDG